MKMISLSPALTSMDRRFPSTIYSKIIRSVWCSRFSTQIFCSSPTTTTTAILPKPDVAYRRSGDLCKALDKIRFESMTDKSKLNGQLELFIPNKNNNALTIIDNGIGMTKAEGLCDCFW
ncbi:unnamed protein product [Prunus brigantina]